MVVEIFIPEIKTSINMDLIKTKGRLPFIKKVLGEGTVDEYRYRILYNWPSLKNKWFRGFYKEEDLVFKKEHLKLYKKSLMIFGFSKREKPDERFTLCLGLIVFQKY